MDSHEDKLKAPSVLDVDLQKLLGFERVDAKQMDAVKPEDAAAVAFNKRGEGVPVSDRRQKSHVRPAGETDGGLQLYTFRFIGDDREFCGVMAQDLLADSRTADAAGTTDGGYYCVDYGKLGLRHLVTDAMVEAGARTLARSQAV